MSLTAAARDQVLLAFTQLAIDAPLTELVTFAKATLNLNDSQSNLLFPEDGAPADDDRRVQLDRLAAALIAKRKAVLEQEARIPDFIVCKQEDSLTGYPVYHVGGLASYLIENQEDALFVARIRSHNAIRAFLGSLGDGFKLESLAAVVLKEIYKNCFATKRAFDQGIDCVSTHAILEVHSWCCGEDLNRSLAKLGDSLHVVASCKANEGNTAQGIPDTIPPAHVRELIGGWLIQRSDSGMWNRKAGVKLLAPLQLLLATTYRLSDASMSLCRELGVAVWGVSHLIYLICKHAPPEVFPESNSAVTFSEAEMNLWINTAEADRLVA